MYKLLNLSCSIFLKSVILLFAFILIFVSCKKTSNTSQPPPPIDINDSSLQVDSAINTDINEFDVTYKALPKQGQIFSTVYLKWSTLFDFSGNNDSMLLSSGINSTLKGKLHIQNLKQTTTYYARLTAVVNGKSYFSSTKAFTTGTLKITSLFGLDTLPISINRDFDQNSVLWTNFSPASTLSINPDTSLVKIYLGNYLCPVTRDDGNIIFFHVPASIPPDSTYSLKLIRKGLTVSTTKSITVLKGLWSVLTPPAIPNCNACGYNANGIGYFGTCHSNSKGYMVGGIYYHGLGIIDSVARPDNNGPFSIREFDGQSLQWKELMPTNPRLYEYPICHFFNNSIYVIGGNLFYPNDGEYFVRTMWRFDLGSLTWFPMGNLPYAGTFNKTGFELNGEWYIGMGLDSANHDSNGTPLPAKDFWKYNPATNIWTRLADFPGGSMNFPTCFTVGSEAYAFYGAIFPGQANFLSEYSKELWKYDPPTNTWIQIKLPTNGPNLLPGEKYQIVSYNGKAYFLTGQASFFHGYYYGFDTENSSLEYDPLSNTFKNISNSSTGGILQLIYQNNNKFYFQSDASGYISNIPNITNLFIPDY
jgi:hypothetical protein